MKFLCLHGTDTNTHVLKMQLAPITFDLEQDSHTFTYLNGSIQVSTPSPSLDPSIPGPFYRYYDRTQIDMDIFTSQFHDPSPSTSTPEDRIRQLRSLGLEHPRSSTARDFVQDFAESSKEGPFDGIIAFSEGAAVAADVILQQARMKAAQPFKCAVFFCGAPPWDYELQRYLLGDESGVRIGIPTVSVVGARDQMRAAGLALWGVCEGVGRGRVLYEHPLGHLVPRSLMGRKAMVGAVRGVVRRVEEREAEAALERVGLEMIEMGKTEPGMGGSETSGSENSGSEASGSDITSLTNKSLEKPSLEEVGMHSEWEGVVDMIC